VIIDTLSDMHGGTSQRPEGSDPASPECFWYVVQTKPRQESRALENLKRQGFRCVLPRVRVERIRRGLRVWNEEPLFSRYVFIELSEADSKWSVLRSTRGVTRVVQFGGVPARLPDAWVAEFMREDRPPVALFEPGERVVITGGPFGGLEGIYQLADGEARAYVLLEILSRPCTGSFAVERLKRVA